MSMRDSITSFPKQFTWQPKIVNAEKMVPLPGTIIVSGMGGSALPALILKRIDPTIDLVIHRDYGLPTLPAGRANQSFCIAVSHSGNTEETLDSLRSAVKAGIPSCVIASGGKLLAEAESTGIPFIKIPAEGIQPRLAIGYMLLAIVALIERTDLTNLLMNLAGTLDPSKIEVEGKRLAGKLANSVPTIYTSSKNEVLGYIWKIKMNETAKVPSTSNVFPELNHNEMAGFERSLAGDIIDSSRFVFIKDIDDHLRIQRRMDTLAMLYRSQSLRVEIVESTEANPLLRLFNSIILADWTALHIAESRKVEPEAVPFIEKFKRQIA